MLFRFFPITTFGFYTGGYLAVNVSGFHVHEHIEDVSVTKEEPLTIGFSIDKTKNDALNPYVETSMTTCILDRNYKAYANDAPTGDAILRFRLNMVTNQTEIECSENIKSINIFKDVAQVTSILAKDVLGGRRTSDSAMFPSAVKKKAKREAANATATPVNNGKCSDLSIPLNVTKKDGKIFYNTSFVIYVANEKEEGLYSLYYHNCHNYHRDRRPVSVDFTVDIEEKNGNSYLSAGEMPLPALYMLMSVLFFLSGCFWVFILRKNGTEQVFRIHWIMAALVFLKSLSLLFHGVNYQKVETHGVHMKSWAILYYVTHLLKGGLLFFTIVLIGSGWAFIKHIFSDKEKRVFMIVLPLQVIANVAYIIVEESEEGEALHNSWREILTLVDLLCCGAILFPVVWSIRHLQEASETDGKAAFSLEKLKLFRHFYIMVVCYIYFTRIIVYLLQITVPFQYEWLDEMFKEMATFVFFVMTGYKFRPASNNPYFNVPTDDYDMEEVLVGSTGINERVTERKKNVGRVFVDSDDEGMVFFPSGSGAGGASTSSSALGKESSHDLD